MSSTTKSATVAIRPKSATRSISPAQVIGTALGYVLLLTVTALVVIPFITMLFDSLKNNQEFYRNVWSVPTNPKFENYRYAWFDVGVLRFMLNSIIVSGVSMVLTVVLGSLAAFAFVRFNFRGKQPLFLMFVTMLIVPIPAMIIPLYVILGKLQLLDTYFALIFPYTAGFIPLSIFILRASFLSFPSDLIDAAVIDGCNMFKAFLYVMVPVMRPALATVGVLAFITAWNEFFLALVFVRSPEVTTLPLGLQAFFYQYSVDWPPLFAALTTSVVPMVVVYVLMQRHVIAGLTAGAVRG